MIKTHTIEIQDAPPSHSVDFVIQASKQNSPTAYYKNKILHSKYNPMKEGEILVNTLRGQAFDAFIVFEMGMGYVVDALYKAFPHIPIIIIEMDSTLYAHITEYIDIETHATLSHASILVEPNENDILAHLYAHEISHPAHITTLAAKNICQETAIKNIIAHTKTYSQKMTINNNALKKFREKWLSNIVQNVLSPRHTLYSVSSMKNMFHNIPTVLCAGGASLETHIPLLATLSGKIPVICVDTALPVLHAHNIVPHIIVSADPQYVNAQHLSWCLSWAIAKGSKLVLDVAAAHQILHQITHATSVYINNSRIPFTHIFFENTLVEKKLVSGGSVAHMGWDLCRYLGSKQIFTMGLDLSFPLIHSHCRGTRHETMPHLQSSRLESAEHLHAHKWYTLTHKVSLRTYDGNIVTSTQQLLEYLKWFEEYLEKHPDITSYSVDETIVDIKGFVLASEQDITGVHSYHAQIQEAMTHASHHHTSINISHIQSMIKHVFKTLESTTQVFKILQARILYEPINHTIDLVNETCKSNKVMGILSFFDHTEVKKSIDKDALPLSKQEKIDVTHAYLTNLISRLEYVKEKLTHHIT